MNAPLSRKKVADVERLVSRMIDERLTEQDCRRIDDLLTTEPLAAKLYCELLDNHEALSVIYPGAVYKSLKAVDTSSEPNTEPSKPRQTRVSRFRRFTFAACIGGLTIALLMTSLTWFVRQHPESVATVTAISGAHIWTGNRGQTARDITVGTELEGGTIEGLAPDSWFQLRFHDGSAVMLSGTSLLTFSDSGQKTLRLREGQMSANIEPQPEGKPMLIQTRSAELKVLGTQFDLQADLTSTLLTVSEGRVNFRRLSDGSAVDVPAKHRVTTDSDSALRPALIPDSVHRWKSQLHIKQGYGKWLPGDARNPASLKAIPLTPPEFPDITLYLAALSVDSEDGSPVVVLPDSKFIVRGRLQAETSVYFGIRVTYPNGDFAGMFRGDLLQRQPAAFTDEKGAFEQTYELRQFTLDPAVRHRHDELADRPDGLILDAVWAFTHMDGPSGLEVTEVEVIPSQQQMPDTHEQ